MQIYIYRDAWIEIEVTNNYIHLIFEVKAIQNANIANFLYYWKTQLRTESQSRVLDHVWRDK